MRQEFNIPQPTRSYQTYCPFAGVSTGYFDIISNIAVKKNKQGDMCINNYIIHRTINSGSYATIRKAYDTLDNEYVALRVVNRRIMAKKFGV